MEKGNSIAEKLYAYLKEKYGIKNTEILNKNELELKSISVNIPGMIKKSDKNSWTIICEMQNKITFVLGENWPSPNCSWTRFLEIQEGFDKNNLDFNKINNKMLSNPYCEFEDLKAFTKVLKDFCREKLAN